jgi:class 3 adenylate cyclase
VAPGVLDGAGRATVTVVFTDLVGSTGLRARLGEPATTTQSIARQNQASPNPIDIRIGLSAGDVTIEQHDVQGFPVVEAARLCAEATGGQILASEVVRLLAGSADRFRRSGRGS